MVKEPLTRPRASRRNKRWNRVGPERVFGDGAQVKFDGGKTAPLLEGGKEEAEVGA